MTEWSNYEPKVFEPLGEKIMYYELIKWNYLLNFSYC